MIRYTGLLPDQPDSRDRRFADLFGVSEDAPEAFSNADLIRRDLRQLTTQTCVGFSASCLAWMEQIRQGIGPEISRLISPAAAYYGGLRRQHGPTSDLIDIGSRPRDVYCSLREIGAVLWEDWPYPAAGVDPNKVLAYPPDDAYWRGSDKDWFTFWRIDELGDERIAPLKQAISRRKGVALGITIDKRFEFLPAGQVWPGRIGAITGRHMVVAYGYAPDGVRIVNWWENWGNDSTGIISWEALCSVETTDLSVVDLNLDKW